MPPITLYAGLGALAVMVGLGGYASIQKARLEASQANYKLFVSTTEQLGKAAIARNKGIIAQQQAIGKERYAALQGRYRDIAARYDSLRHVNPGSSPMPAIPDTARPVDDSARDTRLLQVLRAADVQTAQLIELQAWVKAQQAVK